MIRIQGGAKQTNPEFGRNESKKSPGWCAVMTRGRIIRFAGRASQFRESHSMALSHAMTEYWFYSSIFNRK